MKVSVPDPNQPKRGSLPVSHDTGSDPCWGWFGSGTETTSRLAYISPVRAVEILFCSSVHTLSAGSWGRA